MPNPIGSFFDVFGDPDAVLKPKLRLGAGLGEIGGPLGGMGPPGLGGGVRPPGLGGMGAPGIQGRTLDPMAEARKRMALKPVTI